MSVERIPPPGEAELQYLRRRGNRRVRKVRILRTVLRGWGSVLAHVLPAVLLVALAVQGIRHLGTSRLFALERVEVDGRPRHPEEIEGALAALLGHNLLALDLDEAAERVQALPRVRSASVKRVFPHALRVLVVERAPAARALIAGTVQVVDETGAALGPAGPELADDLPVLVGLEGLEPSRGSGPPPRAGSKRCPSSTSPGRTASGSSRRRRARPCCSTPTPSTATSRPT